MVLGVESRRGLSPSAGQVQSGYRAVRGCSAGPHLCSDDPRGFNAVRALVHMLSRRQQPPPRVGTVVTTRGGQALSNGSDAAYRPLVMAMEKARGKEGGVLSLQKPG